MDTDVRTDRDDDWQRRAGAGFQSDPGAADPR
jgi:hypothetical protein